MSDQTVVNPEPLPPMDTAEAAQWAALEKEYADESPAEIDADLEAIDRADARQPNAPTPEDVSRETKADDGESAEADDEKPPRDLPPEVLRERHRQLQGALKEEREARKALSARAEKMEQLFQDMLRRQVPDQAEAVPAQQQAPEIPSLEDDPIGHFAAKTAALEAELARVREEREQSQQQRQQSEYETRLSRTIASSIQQFAQRTPDYEAAVNHLAANRMAELAVLYPDSPRMTQMANQAGYPNVAAYRNALLADEANQIAAHALQNGSDPAETYYQLAKQRGYTGQPAQPPVTEQPARAPATPRVPNGQFQAAQERIATAAEGVRAQNSMATGDTGRTELTLAELADRYDDDPEFVERYIERAKARGQGGWTY